MRKNERHYKKVMMIYQQQYVILLLLPFSRLSALIFLFENHLSRRYCSKYDAFCLHWANHVQGKRPLFCSMLSATTARCDTYIRYSSASHRQMGKVVSRANLLLRLLLHPPYFYPPFSTHTSSSSTLLHVVCWRAHRCVSAT